MNEIESFQCVLHVIVGTSIRCKNLANLHMMDCVIGRIKTGTYNFMIMCKKPCRHGNISIIVVGFAKCAGLIRGNNTTKSIKIYMQ